MEREYKQKSEMERIEKFSILLDSKFHLPGTKFKFGIDPIIGLIPIVGDVVSFAISSMLVMTMAKHGVSRKVVILMLLNIGIDATLGGIPLLGNFFDFFYKANIKNIRLLKKHYTEGKYQGSGNDVILMITLFFVILLTLLVFGLYELFKFIFGLF